MDLNLSNIDTENEFRISGILQRHSVFLIILALLVFISFQNYLLYHSLIEIFCIVIAFSMLIIAFNTYHVSENHYFMFLGIAYSFIAGIFLFHALTYKGMGVFSGISANIPTQFWIISRYVESISLIVSFVFIKKKLALKRVIAVYSLVIPAVILVVALGLFPDCYIEGQGLTPFKIISEYINTLLLAFAIGLVVVNRGYFPARIYRYMVLSIATTMMAGLSFTFYVSVYGLSNMLGHVFQIISFYLIFRGIIETSLKKPYEFLYFKISQQNDELRQTNLELASKNQQLLDYTTEIEVQQEELEKAYSRIYSDIEKGRKIHQGFLTEVFPVIPGLTFASYYKPAKNIGGDFFNLHQIEDKLLIYLADVSGHGLDGAILNVFIRENIKGFLREVESEKTKISPKETLEFLITQFSKESFPDDYFACVFVALLDLKTNKLTFSNAGLHIEPFVLANNGQVLRLQCPGIPISGAFDFTLFPYVDKEIQLPNGFTLFFTTDGLVEEMKNSEMYGEERLKQALLNSYKLPVQSIVEEINNDFYNFTGRNDGEDDITYLIVKQEKVEQ